MKKFPTGVSLDLTWSFYNGRSSNTNRSVEFFDVSVILVVLEQMVFEKTKTSRPSNPSRTTDKNTFRTNYFDWRTAAKLPTRPRNTVYPVFWNSSRILGISYSKIVKYGFYNDCHIFDPDNIRKGFPSGRRNPQNNTDVARRNSMVVCLVFVVVRCGGRRKEEVRVQALNEPCLTKVLFMWKIWVFYTVSYTVVCAALYLPAHLYLTTCWHIIFS